MRELHPLPQLPDCLEPLGLLPRALRTSSSGRIVNTFVPWVRELGLGERPRDWSDDAELAEESANLEPGLDEPLPVGPVPRDLPPITGPLHYQVQFSTVEEHAQLVERAKALLARGRPRLTLGELHLEAMRLLVASLEKRKFGATD